MTDKTVNKEVTIVSNTDNALEGEETEIAAQVSIPLDGGWGWVVVVAGVFTMAVVDGVGYTFGSKIQDVAHDFKISISLASLVNSLTLSMYFASGPLVSAFINRYGFRACAMSGSVCTSICLFISYFMSSFALLCIFYGVLTGFGLCLMQMSTTLVVGFYFEKLRSLTLSMTSSGASMGVMILSPVNAFIVGKCGWRTVVMLESGLCGVVYFVTMTYRPILSFSVIAAPEDEGSVSRTVTYLPSLSGINDPSIKEVDKDNILKAGPSERLFRAVSNIHFPSTANIIDNLRDETMRSESKISFSDSRPGPSITKSKLTLIAHDPVGGMTKKQIEDIKTFVKSKRNSIDSRVSLEINTSPAKDKGCCGRLCHWYGHINESRPMYRDDVFYEGNIKKLPIYQQSRMGIREEDQTGLEYQLAVTRAVAANDLKERKGVFTIAARRVLSTMLDLSLLSRKSFILIALSSFVVYLGFLVPYIYIQDRAKKHGVDPSLSNFLVSTISLSNLVGRLIWGSLACKFNPITMFSICNIVAGLSVIASNFHYNVYYQFAVSLMFGFFGAATSAFRGIQIVHLYGLQKLTNGIGIVLLFSGMGTLLGPTIASSLTKFFNSYDAAFCASGIFMISAGLLLVPVTLLCKKEDLKEIRIKEIEAQRARKAKKRILTLTPVKPPPLVEEDESEMAF